MTTGTTQPEHALNDDSFYSAIAAAIAAGDDDKVNELMSSGSPVNSADNAEPDGAGTNKEPEAQTSAAVPEEPDATVQEPTPTPPQEPSIDVVALMQELHRVKSEVGRVGNVQSQLAKLQRIVDEQAAVIAAIPKQPSKIDERLESLKEIDPDMAETLLALREEIASSRPEPVPPPAQEADDDGGELERVRRVHPDVDMILVGGAARPAWEQWKSTLTPQQRAYAESAHAEEFSLAYAAFKASMSQPAHRQRGAQQEQSSANAAAIEEERKRKLAGGTGTKATPIRSVADETIVDPEEMVRKLMKEIQKRDNLPH